MRLGETLDALHSRMPAVTRWFGWAGVLLGPVLGLLHLLAAFMFVQYGRGVVEQYDAVQKTGSLLAAPAAQFFILLGFALCLLWCVLWLVRIGLALRNRFARG